VNLLLDTHPLLWWLDDHPSLAARAREMISDPSNVVYLSAVVMWEARIKAALGKLDIPDDFRRVVDRQGFVELVLTIDHADTLAALPFHHRGPFDRMLIAQAMFEGLSVVTADRAFRSYDVHVIPAS
jgi:PIN domain nuclease of toxin-antitoxin system